MPRMPAHETINPLPTVGRNIGRGGRKPNRRWRHLTTALNDMKNKITAFNGLCDAYLVKPIDRSKLIETLQQLKLVS